MDLKLFYSSLILTAICFLVFILQYFLPWLTQEYVLVSSLVQERPWTVITHIFLHGSFNHLFSNMFALALFGIILENLIGSRRFLLIFFASGIVASIGDILFYESTLGASGAIFGIMGALAVLRPKQLVWVMGVPMYMVIALFLWALLDTFGMFYPDDTAHAAHLFGLAFGIITGFFMRRQYAEPVSLKRPKAESPTEKELDKWEKRFMRP